MRRLLTTGFEAPPLRCRTGQGRVHNAGLSKQIYRDSIYLISRDDTLQKHSRGDSEMRGSSICCSPSRTSFLDTLDAGGPCRRAACVT